MIRLVAWGLTGCLLVAGVVLLMLMQRTLIPNRPSRDTHGNGGAEGAASVTSTVTLVGGRYPGEGRIFVRALGMYGGMCGAFLTDLDLSVICRMLYPEGGTKAIRQSAAYFGGNVEPKIVSSTLRCTGTEDDISQCPGGAFSWSNGAACVRGQAAVTCQGSIPMRLAGGSKPYAGRLEVNFNSTWGTVCDTGFDATAARVVCDNLGFWHTSAQFTSAAPYGKATGPIQIENVDCKGGETSLAYCNFDRNADCNHTMDIGINCQPASFASSNVRLTGGVQPWAGRLEMHETFRGNWTSICGLSAWTGQNTKVACLTMGYRYSGTKLRSMSVGSVPLLFRDMTCRTTDSNLGTCPGHWMTSSKDCAGSSNNILALDCSGGIKVRLIGNMTPLEGRVEILQSGKWSTVSNTTVQVEEAKALCASLGYRNTNPVVLARKTYGPGTNSTVRSLSCTGSENHVSQCALGSPVSSTFTPHAAISCFRVDANSCVRSYTLERGKISSPQYPASASDNLDCLYHIRPPPGAAKVYTVEFKDLKLSHLDMIELKETPLGAPLESYKGQTTAPHIHLFKKDVYIRFKTQCCGARTFSLLWAPVTLERAVTVQCSDVAMSIDVSLVTLRWLYPDTDPAYISLVDEGCIGSYTAQTNTWNINNPHSKCFTTRRVNDSSITYHNALIYKEIGSGPIVREHRWRVDIECSFRRNKQISQQYTLTNLYNSKTNLSAIYKSEIHLYNDSTLTTELRVDPIRATLRDDLYVKVNMMGSWNVSMRLQNCVARPTPTSTLAYNLIKDGCASDDQTHIVFVNKKTALFHFKVFEFYAGASSVYLSCDVKFCSPTDTSLECNRKCNTLMTGKRHITNVEPKYHVLQRRLQISP